MTFLQSPVWCRAEKSYFSFTPKGTYPFSVVQLLRLSESRLELTVAVESGTVVGFANLCDHCPHQWVYVGNVIFDKNYRGNGLGRTLVRHMIHSAFDKYGVPEVRISVFSHNTPALLLYTSLQFKPYAIEERLDPSGRRVTLIQMNLSREKR